MSVLGDTRKEVFKAGLMGQNGTSASTAVQSNGASAWWTEEEARLYNQWATSYEKYSDAKVNPYFDYFFTGQDIRIKIDALDDNDFLPIYSFGYQVQQEKMPVYGFASYTYDAVLRGVRIISGAFSLVVTEPHLLTSKIALSASRRAKSSQSKAASQYAIQLLDGDIANIDRYWKRNIDSNLLGQQHLFSIHPPFNFLIKYGIQETSLVAQAPDARIKEIQNGFSKVPSKYTNVNERLVTGEFDNQIKILLENVELTSKAIQYDPSGEPILETYTFLARDERMVSEPNSGNTTNPLPTADNSTYVPVAGRNGGVNRRQ